MTTFTWSQGSSVNLHECLLASRSRVDRSAGTHVPMFVPRLGLIKPG